MKPKKMTQPIVVDVVEVINEAVDVDDEVVDGVAEVVDDVDEVVDDGPTGRARMCCRSKPIGEQRQAIRGAGRLPGLLVGPGPSVNGPEVQHTPWLGEVLGVPPDLYQITKV
jgi:hypothetical protein